MKVFLYLIIGFFSVSLWAQTPKITATIDSTQIKIGSQFHVTLKTKVDTSAVVVFPEENYFGALEVLESYPVDTIKDSKNKGIYELVKKYGMTQFDSGRYVIPKFRVLYNDKTLYTDSLLIAVNNIKVDTLKQNLYDIKEVVASNENSGIVWWQLLLIIALLVGVVYLAWYLIKNKKTKENKEKEIVYTPIEKVTISLRNLERKELIAKGEVKEFYSELTNIAKVYLEEAVKFPALENTTDQLIENLKTTAIQRNLAFTPEIISSLEKVLKQADLVKFAKSKPLEFEIINDKEVVEKTLRSMHDIIPVKTPEEEEAERNLALKLELERKLKRKKQISRISFAGGILLAIIGAYWLANYGIPLIKEKIYNSATQKYIDSEWVTSTYGFPPVKIETPEVLSREESVISSTIANQVSAITTFGYKEMKNDFFVELSVIELNASNQEEQNQELSIEAVLNMNYEKFESQGASNILMQQQSFKSDQGLEGVKAFGTMTIIDPELKESDKVYYEILIFKQAGVYQQVIVSINESDKNKSIIVDRIINSIQVGQGQ